jgi:hypothetical protein
MQRERDVERLEPRRRVDSHDGDLGPRFPRQPGEERIDRVDCRRLEVLGRIGNPCPIRHSGIWHPPESLGLRGRHLKQQGRSQQQCRHARGSPTVSDLADLSGTRYLSGCMVTGFERLPWVCAARHTIEAQPVIR